MQKDHQQVTPTTKSKKALFLGILILALQIGIIFAYAFAGNFSFLNSSSSLIQASILPIYFYMALCAVGIGLMLSFYAKGTALGLGLAILTLAINAQLGPLLQKFWYNVFIGTFSPVPASTSSDIFNLIHDNTKIELSTFSERNSIDMTISFLIAALGFVGRAGLFESFFALVIYNIMWPIPFYVNIRFFSRNLTGQIAFDDFGLTYIYTFAAIFGLVYSIFLNFRKQKIVQNTITSKSSAVLSIFGATLVFCTLPTTGLLYPLGTVTSISNRINLGVLNIYFAEIASIISCTVATLLFGRGKFRIEQIIVSVLSGPAICAQIAGIQSSIVAFLTIGAFGGVVTALWIQIIHPRLNKNGVQDSVGLIGGVLIPSLFGGVLITPVYYKIIIGLGYRVLTGSLNDYEYIRYNYIYYFITVGSGLVAGIIAGIFSCCSKNNQNDYHNLKMFSPEFGLCENPNSDGMDYDHEKEKRQKYQSEVKQSAENLNRND